MDFRELINKLDAVQVEAEKEPRRYTADELASKIPEIVFTDPSPSQAKNSMANNRDFKGKDVNNPAIKTELFRAELKQSPGRLFMEIAERIKPTSDEQIEISNIVGKAGHDFAEGKGVSKALHPFLQAVMTKAIKEMKLERDADQSEYDDNADEPEESIADALDQVAEESTISEAPMLDVDVDSVFGSVDRFMKNVDSAFQDGKVKVEKEPINTNNKTIPNPSKTLRVLWDKEPIKRGNSYWQAIQWADGSVHYVPMADDGTPIWTGEVPNTMKNSYKQKGFGLPDSQGGRYIQKGNQWMTTEKYHTDKFNAFKKDAAKSAEDNKLYDLQTLYVLKGMGYNSVAAAEQAHAKMSPAEQERMESEFEAGMAKAPTDMKALTGGGDEVSKAIELLKSKGYEVSKAEPKSVAPKPNTQPNVIATDIHSESKKAKPDFLDMDKDGDKKEPMKKAIKDKEKKKTNESLEEEVADKKDAMKHLQKLLLMPSIMKDKHMYNKIKARLDRLKGTGESVEESVQEDTWFNDMTDVTLNGDEFYETFGWIGVDDEAVEEAEYQGRKVKLGKPMRGDVKKFKVYVKNPKGNVVKVNFGDPDMKIKKSNPARRKSFRARHNCDSPGPRHKARYWSCRKW